VAYHQAQPRDPPSAGWAGRGLRAPGLQSAGRADRPAGKIAG